MQFAAAIVRQKGRGLQERPVGLFADSILFRVYSHQELALESLSGLVT